MLRALVDWLAGFLWPHRCLACGAYDVALCDGCRRALPASCGVRRLADGTRVAAGGLVAEPVIERAVWHLKYRNEPALAAPLAAWLADAVVRAPTAAALVRSHPLLVPVPLHAARLRERGYNQAELLARRLAGDALTVTADSLTRTRRTAPQVGSGRTERLEHMAGAFSCTRPALVAGRDVLLVDDVCTTGATLMDCARALRDAGARSVAAIVLASG